MMKIGIICAVELELAPFLEILESPKQSIKSMLTVYEGLINGVEIAALFCGVGKTNATIATQVLIDTYGVTHMINAGTAGGMDANLQIFDTVISTEAVCHDVAEGVLTGVSSWIPSVYFKADEKLVTLAKKAATKLKQKIHLGRMVTGDSFIEDNGRDEINLAFSPLSVDMETASIAHTCYVNHVPYIAVRTITDTAESKGHNAFFENLSKASKISCKLTVEILTAIKA